ncbi:MAG: phosphohydrolase, partial [Minisyncoccota bacterium]
IDYSDEFKDLHPTKTKEVLAKYNLEISDEVNQIIRAHSPKQSGVQPISKAQWSIFCADSLTGLITATTFVLPSKKISDVKLSSVVKRFLKEPRFAAGTRRDEVAMCSRADGLNISLEKFIEICLVSMQGIADKINL